MTIKKNVLEEMARHKKKMQANPSNAAKTRNGSAYEASFVRAYDEKEIILKYQKLFDTLIKTNDVNNFLQAASPVVAVELFIKALSGKTDKIKIDAIKDILDRAGFNKINKQQVLSVDVKTSKEAMISLLKGASKELERNGLIIDDDEATDKD